MILTQLSSKAIAQLSKMVKKKEMLLARVEAIENQLLSLTGLAVEKKTRKRGRPRKAKKAKTGPGGKTTSRVKTGGRRGKLKVKIMNELKKAGPKGITVKNLAKKLKLPTNNVFSWFYTTGEKTGEIKKVAPATYALN
jgi:hypothetical protein